MAIFYELKACCCFLGVKHQDSQNSFLAFLNAPTSALDQFEVSTKLIKFICYMFQYVHIHFVVTAAWNVT